MAKSKPERIDHGLDDVPLEPMLAEIEARGDLGVFLEMVEDDELITTEAEKRGFIVYSKDYSVLEDFGPNELLEELEHRGYPAPPDDLDETCRAIRAATRDGKTSEVLRLAEQLYRNVLGVAV